MDVKVRAIEIKVKGSSTGMLSTFCWWPESTEKIGFIIKVIFY